MIADCPDANVHLRPVEIALDVHLYQFGGAAAFARTASAAAVRMERTLADDDNAVSNASRLGPHSARRPSNTRAHLAVKVRVFPPVTIENVKCVS